MAGSVVTVTRVRVLPTVVTGVTCRASARAEMTAGRTVAVEKRVNVGVARERQEQADEMSARAVPWKYGGIWTLAAATVTWAWRAASGLTASKMRTARRTIALPAESTY